MENSNRPVQRVTPIRSEYPNRCDSNINLQSSSSLSEFSCNQNTLINSANVQQYKISNNSSTNNNNIIESLPQFLQQNVNIMNINLPNNAILQAVQPPQPPCSQESLAIHNTNLNFSQPSLQGQKTLFQLSDGRFVQFAQGLQTAATQQQQVPTTILVQMPYKVFDQNNVQKSNQNAINKKFLLPPKTIDKSPQNVKTFSIGPGNTLNVNNDLILSQQIDQTQQQLINDYQQNLKTQINTTNFDQKLFNQTNILQVDKYQEICDLLHNKKLLTKLNVMNEETVLVEFRLNQQKYQLRMTRNQKVEMEKILVSVGNQQKQMEILQVYQAEQRKMMQQRTSVVLNQMVSKNPANMVCNKSPQLQGLNIGKQVYPINSVLVAMPQNQYNDSNFIQATNTVTPNKNINVQQTVIPQTSNGVFLTARLPITPQSSIISSPAIRDANRETLIRQKRNFKTPNNVSPVSNFLPNANANNEMKPARSRRYNNMRKVLLDDHSTVLQPNITRPFTDMNDIVQRLLPYHIFDENKDQKTADVDRILQNAFSELQKKCANLKRISSALSMNELLRDKASENLIIKRMHLDLEKDVFEQEKLLYINNDDNLRITPLQFNEQGNACPILIEIPDSPPILVEEHPVQQQPNDVTTNPLSNSLIPTSDANPVVESIDDSSNVLIENSSDNILDSLFSYDIQDISVDSIDSPGSDIEWTNQYQDSTSGGEVIGNTQSEDPDLDTAIKSILS